MCVVANPRDRVLHGMSNKSTLYHKIRESQQLWVMCTHIWRVLVNMYKKLPADLFGREFVLANSERSPQIKHKSGK